MTAKYPAELSDALFAVLFDHPTTKRPGGYFDGALALDALAMISGGILADTDDEAFALFILTVGNNRSDRRAFEKRRKGKGQ